MSASGTYITLQTADKMGATTVTQAGDAHVEHGQCLMVEESIAQRLGGAEQH